MNMLTIVVLFLLAALVAAIAAALNKAPLWIALVLLWVVVAIDVIPVK
jgi:hypothetical protein